MNCLKISLIAVMLFTCVACSPEAIKVEEKIIEDIIIDVEEGIDGMEHSKSKHKKHHDKR